MVSGWWVAQCKIKMNRGAGGSEDYSSFLTAFRNNEHEPVITCVSVCGRIVFLSVRKHWEMCVRWYFTAGPSGRLKEDSTSTGSTWKPSVHIISSVCHLVRVFIAQFIHPQVNDTVCQWHPSPSAPPPPKYYSSLALGRAEGLSWSVLPVGGLLTAGRRGFMLRTNEMLQLEQNEGDGVSPPTQTLRSSSAASVTVPPACLTTSIL